MAKSATKVHLRNVYKAYGLNGRRLPVLEGIDLYASEGEFVSIVGPSGCGKTTLLNTIAGLQQPESGAVELDGVQDAERLGQVGYMQQKDLLMPWRTVLDNAILGLEVQGMSRREARKRAREHIDAFGLRGFEKLLPYALSGGMRQRAAFLRTVLVSRDVMLLDEPFGALDALTRAELQEWLMELWGSWGKTIILVTHDVDEALLLSDRVYILTPGPGTVRKVLDVDLPRPRHYRMVTEAPFTALKAEVMASLRNQSLRDGETPWP